MYHKSFYCVPPRAGDTFCCLLLSMLKEWRADAGSMVIFLLRRSFFFSVVRRSVVSVYPGDGGELIIMSRSRPPPFC